MLVGADFRKDLVGAWRLAASAWQIWWLCLDGLLIGFRCFVFSRGIMGAFLK